MILHFQEYFNYIKPFLVLSYDDEQFYFILPFSVLMSFQNSKLSSVFFSWDLLPFPSPLHCIFKISAIWEFPFEATYSTVCFQFMQLRKGTEILDFLFNLQLEYYAEET